MRKIAVLGAALLVPGCAGAAVAPHAVTARFVLGKTVYAQTVKVQEGAETNVDGPVGVPIRRMAFNAVVSREGADLVLQYQLEIGDDGGRVIEAQGTVGLRSGTAVTAVECGDWSLEFALDKAAGARRDPKAAWDGNGKGNLRLTADITTPGARDAAGRCCVWKRTAL